MKLTNKLILIAISISGVHADSEHCGPEVSISIPNNMSKVSQAQISRMQTEDEAKLKSTNMPLADFSILCHFNFGANRDIPFVRISRQTLPFSRPSEADLMDLRRSMQATGMLVEKVSYDDGTGKLLIVSSWLLAERGRVKNIHIQKSTDIFNYSLQIRYFENDNTFDEKSLMNSFNLKNTSRPAPVVLPVEDNNWQKRLFWIIMFLLSLLIGLWANKAKKRH